MPKSDTNTQSKVTVNIRPGQVSPAQKQAWKHFWLKVLSTSKDGVKDEQRWNQKSESNEVTDAH